MIHTPNITVVGILATLLFQSLEPAARAQEPLRIPGHTAYVIPDPHGARVNREGVSKWTNPEQKILWGGEVHSSGWLNASVVVKLATNETSKLRLTCGKKSSSATAKGAADSVTVDFGRFEFDGPSPAVFTLESLNESAKSAGVIEALVLSGPASVGAHFNLKERRNAASVHLSYRAPKGEKIEAFYCEATGIEEPLHTFYMACGWHRGYFGMQINSPTERRIIFSVWDSGNEAVSRSKVGDEDRVKLVAKGEGVYSGDFGNEGTGGHSHLKYLWRTGEKQKFIVTAKPTDATHTIFSGFWFHPEKKEWMLISSWRAPKDGGWLRGLHSFSENFGGHNGNLRRKAMYGNQWARNSEGKWSEITTASFSHDETGGKDRHDRFMGVENGEFFLSHGGFVPGFTKYGTPFDRAPLGTPPELKLPALPE